MNDLIRKWEEHLLLLNECKDKALKYEDFALALEMRAKITTLTGCINDLERSLSPPKE